MSQETLNALDKMAEQTEKKLLSAKSNLEKQQLQAELEATLADMREVKTKMDAPPMEKIASSPVGQASQSLMDTVTETAPEVFQDVNTATARTISGFLSAPYELPSFALEGVTAIPRSLGFDVPNPMPQGAGYQTILDFVGANRPYNNETFGAMAENVSESAMVSAPVFAINPIAGAGVFMEEMMRTSMADAARVYINDPTTGNFVANAIEMTPLSPTQIAMFKKQPLDPVQAQKQADKQAQKAREQGSANQRAIDEMTAMQAKASEYGITLTRGEGTGDRVTMAIENSLQRSPEGGVLVDVQQGTANRFMSWMQRSFRVGENGMSPERQRAVITGLHEGYQKSELAKFNARKEAIFKDIPTNATFNAQPILDVISDLEKQFNLVGDGINVDTFTDAQKGLRSGLQRIRESISAEGSKQVFDPATQSFKEVPDGNFTAKDISASELQTLMADIGRATFKGDNPAFGGAPRNMTQTIGRALGGSLNDLMKQAADTNPDLAKLVNARNEFKLLLDDASAASQLPFMKLFDKPLDITNPNIVADSLLDLPVEVADNGKIKMGSQGLAMSLIQDYAPEMLPVIRQRALERVFENAMKDKPVLGSSGKQFDVGYDSYKLKQGLEGLETNLFFADLNGKRAFNEYKNNLEPIMARVSARELDVSNVPPEALAEKIARVVTEISGVVGGTPARYTAQVGERITETVSDMMRDPRALAQLAVSPYTPTIVRKAIEGKTLKPEELKKLGALMDAHRIRLAQDLGQMTTENEEWKAEQEAKQAAQMQTLQQSAQPMPQ
jgi:hypothetical protein